MSITRLPRLYLCSWLRRGWSVVVWRRAAHGGAMAARAEGKSAIPGSAGVGADVGVAGKEARKMNEPWARWI